MRHLLADTTPLKVSADYRRLWFGLSISNIGTQVTVVAVGLQIYALTGSTLAVGLLGLFSLVPLVVLGLYGGALVDHYDRRKVSLLSSLVLWVVVAGIAAQAWFEVESVHLLYGLVAVQSAAFAINNPARSAIVPRLLPKELMPAANALMTLSWNVALTGGPLIGAVLVSQLGYAWAYTLDMVLFLAALWAVFRLPPVPPEGTEPAGTLSGRGRVGVVGLRSVLDGLRYLATQPNVRTTFLVDICAMVLSFPRVLWPAAGVIYLGGGETTTGLLAAAFAAGGILAGVFSGGLTRLRKQGQVIIWAITAWAVSIVAFGLVLVLVGRGSPDGPIVWAVVAAGVALALAGGSDSVSSVFRQSILQTATPDHMRGRLQGVFIVVVAGGPRLGEMVLGAEATWFGEGWAAVVGGLTCLALLWLIVRLTPRFWRYDARNPQP
ncbi:MFS transporter [Promicromonospora sp. NPDC060271]|uniref:MFS transporter n=1 Tax=Promicromonospora sp. NPDC060271 TaxID=3347089 RepID=UPI00366A41EC